MSQNKWKIIDILIGNLATAIVHSILEKSIIQKPELSIKYRNELLTSFDIAKRYREKINPKDSSLPISDLNYIKDKLIKRIRNELQTRISRGYQNINLEIIETEVDNALKELKIN